MSKKSDFGLIGLAVMGQNLVLNVESRGFQVTRLQPHHRHDGRVHREASGQEARRREDARGVRAEPRHARARSRSWSRPAARWTRSSSSSSRCWRRTTSSSTAATASTPTPSAATRISPARGLRFIGAGVSGGEEGARKGPSIMPGGPPSTWEVMKPIFESIAAKVDGEPCVIHIGPGGAGHYVKMIHNGIEYGDMQLICEAYNIFKHAGFTTDEMADDLQRLEQRRPRRATSSRSPARRSNRRTRRPASRSSNSSSTRPARKAPASGRCSTPPKTPSSSAPSTPPSKPASSPARRSSASPPARNCTGPKAEHHHRQGRAREESPRCPLRLQDHQLRPGPRPHQDHGREEELGPRPRPHRRHLARRLHHPRPLPQPHHRRLPQQSRAGQPDARSVLQGPAQPDPAELARSRRPRHSATASRCPRSAPASATTTATAPHASPPTCSRPSATSSAPTPTSASTSPKGHSSTPSGRR